MSDVASRASVSPSTVSLFLRRPEAVSSSVGRVIARAIDDLGYVPSLVAGGLAAASSRVVSVIVPSVRNAFFAETVSALQADLARERLNVLLGHTEYDLDEEEALVRTALSWRAAAIVLTGLTHTAGTRRLLQASATPVVEIWELGGPQIDMAVGFDHALVGETAARHLVERGRRKLLFVGARMADDRRAAARCSGFLATAAHLGVEAAAMEHPGPATVEIGPLLLAQALRAHPDVDGMAFSNDHLALGALFECQRRKIDVPQRLALLGFGDLGFSSVSNPPLTTIKPSGELIGQEVARLIRRAVESDEHTPGISIDTHHVLVQRLTT
jgi:LacI family transcriptional regulator, gluconate utilization system Gnt-I transcriptional repressor